VLSPTLEQRAHGGEGGVGRGWGSVRVGH
jgi:hypothetical protein